MSFINTASAILSLHSKVGLNAVPRNEQGLVIDPREASFHLLYETVSYYELSVPALAVLL